MTATSAAAGFSTLSSSPFWRFAAASILTTKLTHFGLAAGTAATTDAYAGHGGCLGWLAGAIHGISGSRYSGFARKFLVSLCAVKLIFLLRLSSLFSQRLPRLFFWVASLHPTHSQSHELFQPFHGSNFDKITQNCPAIALPAKVT